MLEKNLFQRNYEETVEKKPHQNERKQKKTFKQLKSVIQVIT